ncbi:hypothetical protein Q8A73_010737 [Channa argus]|nr:hypothetical protein Q8A73_010737 [Channa argus]
MSLTMSILTVYLLSNIIRRGWSTSSESFTLLPAMVQLPEIITITSAHCDLSVSEDAASPPQEAAFGHYNPGQASWPVPTWSLFPTVAAYLHGSSNKLAKLKAPVSTFAPITKVNVLTRRRLSASPNPGTFQRTPSLIFLPPGSNTTSPTSQTSQDGLFMVSPSGGACPEAEEILTEYPWVFTRSTVSASHMSPTHNSPLVVSCRANLRAGQFLLYICFYTSCSATAGAFPMDSHPLLFSPRLFHGGPPRAQIPRAVVERAENVRSLRETGHQHGPRYFLVPQKCWEMRPILDVSLLNQFMVVRCFHMLTTASVLRSMRPGDGLSPVDLKDVYFHIAMQHRKFLHGGSGDSFIVSGIHDKLAKQLNAPGSLDYIPGHGAGYAHYAGAPLPGKERDGALHAPSIEPPSHCHSSLSHAAAGHDGSGSHSGSPRPPKHETAAPLVLLPADRSCASLQRIGHDPPSVGPGLAYWRERRVMLDGVPLITRH